MSAIGSASGARTASATHPLLQNMYTCPIRSPGYPRSFRTRGEEGKLGHATIMKHIILVVVLSAFAVPAIAAPFDGRWSLDQSNCPEKSSSEDMASITIEGNEVGHYESSCTISKLDPIGDKDLAWRVTGTCSGEGQQWPFESVYAFVRDVADGAPNRLATIDLETGYATVYRRCE